MRGIDANSAIQVTNDSIDDCQSSVPVVEASELLHRGLGSQR